LPYNIGQKIEFDFFAVWPVVAVDFELGLEEEILVGFEVGIVVFEV
jgi:hypothetical protein